MVVNVAQEEQIRDLDLVMISRNINKFNLHRTMCIEISQCRVFKLFIIIRLTSEIYKNLMLLNYEFSVWKSLYINWQKIIHTTWSMFWYRNMHQHGCGVRNKIQSINSDLIIHEHNVNTRIDELYPSYSPVINSTECASVAFYLSLPFLFFMWTQQSFSIQIIPFSERGKVFLSNDI